RPVAAGLPCCTAALARCPDRGACAPARVIGERPRPEGAEMSSRMNASRCAMLLVGLLLAAPAVAVDIESFTRRQQFRDLKLSPDGQHLAATVQVEDRTGIVVMRLSDMSATARFSLGRNTDIPAFQWANNE